MPGIISLAFFVEKTNLVSYRISKNNIRQDMYEYE